jgi:hypothetical protein
MTVDLEHKLAGAAHSSDIGTDVDGVGEEEERD